MLETRRHYGPGELLDCGHVPSEPEASETKRTGSGGTGYGYTLEGQEAARAQCYDCCAQDYVKLMRDTGHAVLYLTLKRGSRAEYEVSDWGGRLRFPAFSVKQSKYGGGFGAQCTSARFIGPDGWEWSAVNRGDNQLAHCKRLKRQTAYLRKRNARQY